MSPSDELDALQLGPDPDKLELYHRQQLSAMLDGELAQDQARFLRRRLQHDADLSDCFERWQVGGDVLRGRQVSLLPADFADRVARAIEADGVPAAPARPAQRPRLLRWGGGAALAASVAMAAFFVGRPGDGPGDAFDTMPMTVADTAVPLETSAPDATADAGTPMTGSPGLDAGMAAVAVAAAAADTPRRRSGGQAPRSPSRPAAPRLVPATGAPVATAAPRTTTDAARSSNVLRSNVAGFLAATPVASGLPELTVAPRAWPRASALAASSSFSVGYDTGFSAPSWVEPEGAGSSILPSFPVAPDDLSSRALP